VIADLGRAVEDLRAEVAELRRRLGRNSRNSSMPPSADDLPGRQPPRRERRKGGTGRRRGKQPGAPGAAMSWAEPDEVVDHRPAGACDGCEFRHAVLAGLSDLPRIPGPKSTTAQHPGRDLLEFCRDRQEDVTRFCHDTRVWPTNNISERGLRPAKTQQKISGRLTSEQVTQARLDIRSYIDTARKHGHGAIAVLRAALTGTPWSPPVPATA
jgi:Family of unknown function (DUF6444)/Transposase IS66 family